MRSLCGRIVALVFAFGVLIAAAAPVYAGPYEDALPKFTTDEFDDTIDGINAVAASGNPLAAPLIQALKDGRLLFSAAQKKVYIKTTDDKMLDAATGQPIAGNPPDDADNVRLNNRAAQHHRRRARQPHPDGARSRPPLRRGAVGVQVAR